MNKILKGLAAIAFMALLGIVTPHGVDASASMGGDEGHHAQTEWQQNDFNSYLHRIFNNWGHHWNQDRTNEWQEEVNETEQQPDQPDQEGSVQPAPTPEQPEAEQQPSNEQTQQDTGELNQFEQEVVELTNQERLNHGLQALKIDNELSKVAREKSQDMQANNYFDHNSPTYGSPFDMMKSFGINYQAAGENIAKGQRTPEEVVNAWMNSQGHRENILNGSFTHIGVGYLEQGNVWTQQFIGK